MSNRYWYHYECRFHGDIGIDMACSQDNPLTDHVKCPCGRPLEVLAQWPAAPDGFGQGLMGLRDRFACAAMQSVLAGNAGCGMSDESIATAAYVLADLMLAERQKKAEREVV